MIVSALPLAAWIGATASGPILQKLGRRGTLISAAIPYILAGIAGYTAARLQHPTAGFWLLLAARILSGWSSGICTATVPLYLSEVAPSPALRGTFACGSQLGAFAGSLMAQAMTMVVSGSWTWHTMFLIPMVASMVWLIACSIGLLETPIHSLSAKLHDIAVHHSVKLYALDTESAKAHVNLLRVQLALKGDEDMLPKPSRGPVNEMAPPSVHSYHTDATIPRIPSYGGLSAAASEAPAVSVELIKPMPFVPTSCGSDPPAVVPYTASVGEAKPSPSIFRVVSASTPGRPGQPLQKAPGLCSRHSQSLWPFIIGVILMITQSWCGIVAVFSYAGRIFATSGIPPVIGSVSASSVLLIGAGVSAFLMDRKGRRALMIKGGVSMAIMCIIVMALTVAMQHDMDLYGAMPYLYLGSMALLVLSFSLGLVHTPFVLAPELFSSEYRSSAVAWLNGISWAGTVALAATYPAFEAWLGPFSFMPFLISLAIFVLVVHFWVPETAKVTQDVIEQRIAERRPACCAPLPLERPYAPLSPMPAEAV